jgi:acyl carrier protein
MEHLKETIRTYISNEFLPHEDAALLNDTTPLVTDGILDSLAILKLVVFLEEQYKIQLQAHELVAENMNTIPDIVNLVQSKL